MKINSEELKTGTILYNISFYTGQICVFFMNNIKRIQIKGLIKNYDMKNNENILS